jgi:hypothetical protein
MQGAAFTMALYNLWFLMPSAGIDEIRRPAGRGKEAGEASGARGHAGGKQPGEGERRWVEISMGTSSWSILRI